MKRTTLRIFLRDGLNIRYVGVEDLFVTDYEIRFTYSVVKTDGTPTDARGFARFRLRNICGYAEE